MNPESLEILPRSFYDTEDIIGLSKKLLGVYLVSEINNSLCIGRIVELEAYRAPDDKGSHAYGNKRTKRTEVMFGQPGRAYVYLCYGIHKMLNVVTASEGIAHAILIRAIEPVYGIDTMMKRRKLSNKKMLANGPGKLCQALGIAMDHNATNLCSRSSDLWIARNKNIDDSDIVTGPRVGIAYAEECAHWPWRFRVKNSGWTSPPADVSYSK